MSPPKVAPARHAEQPAADSVIAAIERPTAAGVNAPGFGSDVVADTLRALGHDAEAVEAESRAVAASAEALRLIQVNYQTGVATYLQVLVADTQYLQAQLGYLQAKTQRLQDTVALYVALGGGWWNSPDKVAELPSH